MKIIPKTLSFDDVLIVPHESDVLAENVSVSTMLTKGIALKMPILSAAMDTVTTYPMAISIALYGGIGVIHRSMNIEEQSKEISLVKNYKFDRDEYYNATVDNSQRLMVAGAVGTGEDGLNRAQALIDVGVDCLIVDTAHGHNKNVIETVKQISKIKKNVGLIAGNVVTVEAAKALVEEGADGIKVGIGPGSICTTRIVAGVGIPQFTAIMQIAEFTHKNAVTLIADGGIKSSGDIAKAIAAGADCVMLGGMLAGTDQAPGEVVMIEDIEYKLYRGMGSLAAMKSGSAGRYFQKNNSCSRDFIPEGVEGFVRYKGDVGRIVHQLLGGLKASMGYTGNRNISEMQKNCQFVEITAAGLRESNVHSLSIIQNS